MARFQGDLITQKDLMRWGIGAIAAFAAAVIAANLAAFVPGAWLTGLHATPREGGNLQVLQAEVAALRAELGRADRANAQLATRLMLVEDGRAQVAQRVGALEASVPMLLEALPWDADIDRNLVTAGIGEAEAAPAEGGTVVVRRRPLFAPGSAGADAPSQPMPPAVAAAEGSESAGNFGLALGAAVTEEAAWGTWLDYADRIGALLIGMHPVFGADDNGDGAARLIAGPVADYAEAMRLCAAIAKQDIACQATEFAGQALGADAP